MIDREKKNYNIDYLNNVVTLLMCCLMIIGNSKLFAFKVVPTITRDGDEKILDKSNYPFIAEYADGIQTTFRGFSGYSKKQIERIKNNFKNRNLKEHGVWKDGGEVSKSIKRYGFNVMLEMFYQEAGGMDLKEWKYIMSQKAPYPILAHTRRFNPEIRSFVNVADGAEIEFPVDQPDKYKQAADLLIYCLDRNKICSFFVTYRENDTHNLSAFKAFYYYLKKYLKTKNKLHYLYSSKVVFNVNTYHNYQVFADKNKYGGTFGTSRWLIEQRMNKDNYIQSDLSIHGIKKIYRDGEKINLDVKINYTQKKIEKVELYLDELLIGTDKTAPYQFKNHVIKLDKISPGRHFIRAVATDKDGKVSDKSMIIEIAPDAHEVPGQFFAKDNWGGKINEEKGAINLKNIWPGNTVIYKVKNNVSGIFNIDVDLSVQRSKLYGGTISLFKGKGTKGKKLGEFTTILNDPDKPALRHFIEDQVASFKNIHLNKGEQFFTFSFSRKKRINNRSNPMFHLNKLDFRMKHGPEINIIYPSVNDLGVYDAISGPVDLKIEAEIKPKEGASSIDYADLYIGKRLVRRIVKAPYEWDGKNDNHLSNLGKGNKNIKIVSKDNLGRIQYKQIELKIVKRKPYNENLTIPGTIQAWHFDQGGEGVAYHDFNIGSDRGLTDNAYPRLKVTGIKEDVEIDRVGNDYALSGVRWNEWLFYTLKSVQSGVYDVSFIAATRHGKKANIQLLLNGKDIGKVAITGTGSNFSNYKSFKISGVKIPDNLQNAQLQLIFTTPTRERNWLFFCKEFSFTKIDKIETPASGYINSPKHNSIYKLGDVIKLSTKIQGRTNNLSKINYHINGKFYKSSSVGVEEKWKPSKVGDYKIKARLITNHGVKIDTKTNFISVIRNKKPNIVLDYSQLGGEYNVGDQVKIKATATDPDGKIKSIQLIVNNKIIAKESSENFYKSWKINQPGEYEFFVRAYDNNNVSTDSEKLNILVNRPNLLPIITMRQPHKSPIEFVKGASPDVNFEVEDKDGFIKYLKISLNGKVLVQRWGKSSISLFDGLNKLNPGKYTLLVSAKDNHDGWTHLTVPMIVNKAMLLGSFKMSDKWETIKFPYELKNPIVVLSPLTDYGSQPATVKLRNITTEGFEAKVKEWDYLDGNHLKESVSYMAMEEGVHTIDGLIYEAKSIIGDDVGQDVYFKHDFKAQPIVLPTVEEYNNQKAIVPHISNVDLRKFHLKLQHEERLNTKNHEIFERVNLIAIQKGKGDLSESFITDNKYNHLAKTLYFKRKYKEPLFFAFPQSGNSKDPFSLRVVNESLKLDNVKIYIHEEKSYDKETLRKAEEIGYLVWEDLK